MLTTVLIVALVALSLWLALGGPVPNLIPSRARERVIISAWVALRMKVEDEAVRSKLDELLPLLLKSVSPRNKNKQEG